MDRPHDQTLYWGWVPTLDPDFDIIILTFKDWIPDGIERVAEDTYRVHEKFKTRFLKHPSGVETVRSTTFHAHLEDNFIVLRVVGGTNNDGFEEEHADTLYNALKNFHHSDIGHTYGNGLHVTMQPDLASAVNATWNQLQVGDYLKKEDEVNSLVMNADDHVRYLSYLDHSAVFLKRYQRFFSPVLLRTYVDKTWAKLNQTERLMNDYVSVKSVELAHSSKMLSTVAVVFALISLVVSFSAIVDNELYPLLAIPIASVVILFLGISSIRSDKRNGPRNGFKTISGKK